MNAPLYTTDILRLAASLQGPRALERIDGQAELRSATCGSRIQIRVQLGPDGRVEALSQQVNACAFGQASAALLEAKAVGLNHDDATAALDLLSGWLANEQDDLGSWQELLALSPARVRQARHGAILLPLRTLIAALDSGQ